MLKNAGLGAKNPLNIFVKNVVGRFGVIFPKIAKFQKWGLGRISKNPFREKRLASMALGGSFTAKILGGDFRDIVKTGNPPSPPPGGETVLVRPQNLALSS